MTMTQTTTDLSRHLADSTVTGHRWFLYEFPNGHSVSVIPDPRPGAHLRFEVETTDPADEPTGGIVAGLSTDQVEAKLAAVAALPEPEPADDTITVLVTVDDRGHLTPESTVTVGEWTWPVPEQTERGGVRWMPRVAEVLREHGYWPRPDWQPMASTLGPHYSEVRVERIKSDE